ncbi:MAG: hypothetical protein C4520_11600 [Candidatus Abyssobacteria bacterium SURF_5]|uniref:Uncharacterized protein n=1 Tax=Abyssobacteria bacterium (strain SURF_5) TaxID=2093360 RepID=A0A3A4NT85_ABYX5|nr:MAG: hypothetical protein C4520_11600 [Candidatus Abyssubacteria bacterium SURF_5]
MGLLRHIMSTNSIDIMQKWAVSGCGGDSSEISIVIDLPKDAWQAADPSESVMIGDSAGPIRKPTK